MFGIVSLPLTALLLAWRYLLASILGGLTLMAFYIADKTLLTEFIDPIGPVIEELLPATIFNSLIIAICAIPASFLLILIGKIINIKSRIYYMLVGGISGFGALWILVNIFDHNHISLDPSSIKVMTTVGGGILAGFFYRMIAIR